MPGCRDAGSHSEASYGVTELVQRCEDMVRYGAVSDVSEVGMRTIETLNKPLAESTCAAKAAPAPTDDCWPVWRKSAWPIRGKMK